MQTVPAEVKYAKELYERVRREFPEFRIFTFYEFPVGAHTHSSSFTDIAM